MWFGFFQRGFMKKKRNSWLRRALIKSAAALSAVFIENHLLQKSEYRIVSEKIPKAFDGLRIMQLSDLHSKRFGRGNERLLAKIDVAGPDLIVMTGDMVTRTDFNHNIFFSLAETLGKSYPVYYIIGNHEQDMPPAEMKAFLSRLSAFGIQVLDNQKIELHRENQSINLYGMWFSLKYYKEAKRASKYVRFGSREMRRTMGVCDTANYAILLTHNPLCFEIYADWGADLTLCGHVHGGMIRLPFLGALLSPERKFFPKYSGGLYQYRGKSLIVSRGLGTGAFGARIFNRPEIVIITLCHNS